MYFGPIQKRKDDDIVMPDGGMYLILCYLVPFAFGSLIYSQSLDKSGSGAGFLLVTYASTALLGGMSILTFFHWIRNTTPLVKVMLYTVLLFCVTYTIGLFIAEYVPSITDARRHLIGNFWPVTLIIILLLTPKEIPQLHRTIEVVMFVFGLIGIHNLFTEFMSGGIAGDRLGGFFGQPNIAATWVIVGMIVWRERSKNIHFDIPIIPIITLGLGLISTLAVMFTGSLLGMIQVAFVFIYFVAESVPPRLQLVTLIFMSLSMFGVYAVIQTIDTSQEIINYRITSLIKSAQSPDDSSGELDANTSFSGRWAATEAGMKVMPETIIVGRGLGRDKVYVEYWQGIRYRISYLSPHNVIVHTWLTAGGIGGTVYIIFLILSCVHLWMAKGIIWIKRLSLIIAMLLTIIATTQAFNLSVVPLYLVMFIMVRRDELNH